MYVRSRMQFGCKPSKVFHGVVFRNVTFLGLFQINRNFTHYTATRKADFHKHATSFYMI